MQRERERGADRKGGDLVPTHRMASRHDHIIHTLLAFFCYCGFAFVLHPVISIFSEVVSALPPPLGIFDGHYFLFSFSGLIVN